MARTDEPERVALTVPLEAVGSSPGRARVALAIWAVGLAAIAWIGLAGHEGAAEAASGVAPVAAIPATTAATSAATPLASTTVSRGTVRYLAAPVAVRHTLGEDGLMGGIVFGDNIPVLSQADLERDGFRYFQALNAHDPSVGHRAPP